MGNTIEDFCKVCNIQNEVQKRTRHYQLTVSKNQRINDNVKKISEVFCSYEINVENSDVVLNVLRRNFLLVARYSL